MAPDIFPRTGKGAVASFAACAAAIDRPADQPPATRAQQCDEGSRAPIGKRIAQHSAGERADDQAGRTVGTAAIVSAVAAAIETVVACQAPFAITAVIAIIMRRIIACAIARIRPIIIVTTIGAPFISVVLLREAMGAVAIPMLIAPIIAAILMAAAVVLPTVILRPRWRVG